MSEKMREEFEAAMRLRGYTQFARRGQRYQFDDVDMLWQGFQIGRQSQRDLRKDAERWNAFVNCARIKFFGWAGYSEKDPNGNSPGNYRHFGGEFWTIHDAPTTDKAKAREILNGFADAAIEHQEL